MNAAFNNWWDGDIDTTDNPYRKNCGAYWAWAGWKAGVKAEREACAVVCEEDAFVEQWKGLAEAAQRIRARGNT